LPALLDELATVYGHLGLRRLTGEIQRAVADLHGSVSPGALPEMAARLAMYRLARSQATDPLG
jgi:hypothetical protein